jgi:hypothetical protein
MKNHKSILMLAVLFLCAAAVPAFAQEEADKGKKADSSAAEIKSLEEKEAESTVGQIEDRGRREGAQEQIANKLKAQFGVDDARLQAMREAGLSQGEISLALALAKGMPGGINDKNVQKVTSLRQGPPKAGWGNVAKDLGLKLGTALSSTRKLTTELRKDEEIKRGKKGRKDDKGARDKKGGRPDRPAKGARG